MRDSSPLEATTEEGPLSVVEPEKEYRLELAAESPVPSAPPDESPAKDALDMGLANRVQMLEEQVASLRTAASRCSEKFKETKRDIWFLFLFIVIISLVF